MAIIKVDSTVTLPRALANFIKDGEGDEQKNIQTLINQLTLSSLLPAFANNEEVKQALASKGDMDYKTEIKQCKEAIVNYIMRQPLEAQLDLAKQALSEENILGKFMRINTKNSVCWLKFWGATTSGSLGNLTDQLTQALGDAITKQYAESISLVSMIGDYVSKDMNNITSFLSQFPNIEEAVKTKLDTAQAQYLEAQKTITANGIVN